MKISIVIPSNNEAHYIETLIAFINKNSNSENIEEIIIVESFSTKRIIKLAEKSHAKLYYNLINDKLTQMEMGAFQAKGEIIYFIKPGCIPPAGFDVKIKKYASEQYAMGCFDYEVKKMDNVFIKLYKWFCRLIFKDIMQAKSFYMISRLYHQSGGFKDNRNYTELKRQVRLSGNIIYN